MGQSDRSAASLLPTHSRKFRSHPACVPHRDLDVRDPDGICAGRYGWLNAGSNGRTARGLRVLVRQGSEKGAVPITWAYETDKALSDAMRAVQGEAGWFTPFATFAQGYHHKGLGALSARRFDDNVQDVSGSVWDFDWDRHPFASTQFTNAEEVWEHIQARADEMGWPALNHATLTGRGLLVGYRYEPVPFYDREYESKEIKKAASGAMVMRTGHKWRQLQIYVYHVLVSPLSDDRSCLSPSHFYKIAGTLNVKSGKQARVIREPDGQIYTFTLLYNWFASRIKAAYLAGELDGYQNHGCWPAEWMAERQGRRPATSSSVVSLDVARALRKGLVSAKVRRQAKDGEKGRAPVDPAVIGQVIAAPRIRAMADFAEALKNEGRWNGAYRQKVMFMWATCLSWMDAQAWKTEFLGQVAAVEDLGDKETMRRVSTIVRRVQQALAGETREWQGRQDDPRYKFRNATVRGPKWLNLSDADYDRYPMLSCFAPEVIQTAIYQRRQNASRQANGRKDRPNHTGHDRAGYEAKTKDSEAIAKAHALRESGQTVAQIAKVMGKAKSTVHNYLKHAPEAVARAVQAAQDAEARRAASKPQRAPQAAPKPVGVVSMAPSTAAAPRIADEAACHMARRLYLQDGISDINAIARMVRRSAARVAEWLSEPEVLALRALLVA